jgi:hypothetical protein
MKYLPFFIMMIVSLSSFSQTNDSIRYSITIGGQYQSGNVNSSLFSTMLDVSGYRSKHSWSILPTYKYFYNSKSPSNSSPSEQNEFYSVQNWNWRNDKPIRMLFFSEIEHSQIKKIQLRYNIGWGVGFKIIKSNNIDLGLSEVLLPDYYQSMNILNINSKNSVLQRNNESIRSSTRLKFTLKKSNISIISVIMIQPALYTKDYDGQSISILDNTNFRSTEQIDFTINNGLSYGLMFDYDYQSYLGYINYKLINKLSPSDYTLVFYLRIKGKI